MLQRAPLPAACDDVMPERVHACLFHVGVEMQISMDREAAIGIAPFFPAMLHEMMQRIHPGFQDVGIGGKIEIRVELGSDCGRYRHHLLRKVRSFLPGLSDSAKE